MIKFTETHDGRFIATLFNDTEIYPFGWLGISGQWCDSRDEAIKSLLSVISDRKAELMKELEILNTVQL